MKKSNFFGYELYSFGSETLEVSVTTLGATLTRLRYKGRELVLNYPNAEGYLQGDAYICAYVGRVANRISGAKFTLNGKEYVLPANMGEDMLHGGPRSYDKRCWHADIIGERAVRFTLNSHDGDNGFPGNLTASVTYSIENERLRLDFGGHCDADTFFAPTSHMYFNFDGKSVLGHSMQINADEYLELSDRLIPTGRIIPTAGGDYDFYNMRELSRDYDTTFILNSTRACTVEAGGIRMELDTDFPAIQVYTSVSMGPPHGVHAGLAIEPEFYPDSLNRPEFPAAILRAGEEFSRYAEYSFSEV